MFDELRQRAKDFLAALDALEQAPTLAASMRASADAVVKADALATTAADHAGAAAVAAAQAAQQAGKAASAAGHAAATASAASDDAKAASNDAQGAATDALNAGQLASGPSILPG